MLDTEYNEAEIKELFMEDGRKEGIVEGLKKGIEEGLKIGRAEGEEERKRLEMKIKELEAQLASEIAKN